MKKLAQVRGITALKMEAAAVWDNQKCGVCIAPLTNQKLSFT